MALSRMTFGEEVGTKRERGTPKPWAAWAMAKPALPPELPTRRVAPLATAIWQVRPMPRILKEPRRSIEIEMPAR